MKVYCVFDKKMNKYVGPLMNVEQEVQATRQFEQSCNTSGTLLNDYASDFRLDYLGEFNPDNGVLSQPGTVIAIVKEALECVGVKND